MQHREVGVMFENRIDAGRRLARRLHDVHDVPRDRVVVLGLPRGGVPVAFEVARALAAPLDVIVVRKLGAPGQPELAMGAIGEGGVRVLNQDVVRALGVSEAQIAEVEAREREELARRSARFRGSRAPQTLAGRVALVVDDGVATGATARAACEVARAHGAARVIFAVPVGPAHARDEMRAVADDVVILETPAPFFAIGQFYDDFTQVGDDEVARLLARAAARDEEVVVRAGDVDLAGHLTVPENARGIVVFAHGSGSSRHSPRNQFVADVLHAAGLGTLLFDLLTPDEERDRANVFDIGLLGHRLLEVTRWLRTEPGTAGHAIGYFGASTGAGAALWAAAERDGDIAAVVSRGGRPDLAAGRLGAVHAPTLLIVGGHDHAVLAMNRAAQEQMTCESRLSVVPGASHLFEEPGTLARAAELARDWFVEHLPSRVPANS